MRARVAHAPTTTLSANLADDFGYNFAVRMFGQQAIDSLPVLKAGKNKGKTKGHILWLKTTGKGFHPMANGGVGEGQILWVWIGETAFAPSDSALVGFWMGRWQNLSGSKGILSDQARRNEVRDRIRERNAQAEDFRSRGIEESPDQMTASAERWARWQAEDLARSFPNDPHRRAFAERLATLRTFGPTI